MKILDISLTITPGLPVWPGDPAVRLEQVAAMDQGAEANVSHISLGVHTGTHVDAPHHFMNDGRTVENLPLDVLMGACHVLHLPGAVDIITADVLTAAAVPPGCTRLLLRTRNSARWAAGESAFFPGFVALAVDAAAWLVARGVRLVGVDYLSVAPYGDSVPTHRALLGAGVVVVEGLDLSAVPPGAYQLACLPLKIGRSDGAPARVLLVAEE